MKYSGMGDTNLQGAFHCRILLCWYRNPHVPMGQINPSDTVNFNFDVPLPPKTLDPLQRHNTMEH
eukprot:552949-Ditylum_brightwellii.AAC.1